MLFGKLLPKEGNFFELFNQHAERIVEAARAFSNLVANYSDLHLREKYNRDVDNAEHAADRVTQEVNRLIHAFRQGVREVKPDATFQVAFINTWFDPTKAKEAALAHLRKRNPFHTGL